MFTVITYDQMRKKERHNSLRLCIKETAGNGSSLFRSSSWAGCWSRDRGRGHSSSSTTNVKSRFTAIAAFSSNPMIRMSALNCSHNITMMMVAMEP